MGQVKQALWETMEMLELDPCYDDNWYDDNVQRICWDVMTGKDIEKAKVELDKLLD